MSPEPSIEIGVSKWVKFNFGVNSLSKLSFSASLGSDKFEVTHESTSSMLLSLDKQKGICTK